jgi:hypothetical protein
MEISYPIILKKENKTLAFEVSSKNEQLIKDFVLGLFNFFGDKETMTVEAVQKIDSVKKNEILVFLEQFRSKFPPVLNQVFSFFNKLEENEYFLFLPGIELTAETGYQFHNQLIALRTNEPVEVLNEQFEKIFGPALVNYDIAPSGSIRKFIGNYSMRKCRFCYNNETTTTFSQTAHAISEGLGNKKVFLYDECDQCNDKFSREIEPDLINYLSFFRTIFDVKGKGGSKKIKGKDFTIENNNGVMINFDSIDRRPDPTANNYDLEFEMPDKVNTQDIYRCLCKFVLSVIDEEHLPLFQETIKWINKETSIKQLPKIAELISNNHLTKEPLLFVYIRKNNDKNLPFAVGEFHLTLKIITFIIPLSDADSQQFIDDSKFNHFWKQFVNYNRPDDWVFNDFSNDKERDFTFKLSTTVRDEN